MGQDSSSVDCVTGLDVGDRWIHLHRISRESGEKLEEGRIRTSPSAMQEAFSGRAPERIALEVGTHSPWLARLLEGLGHEVLVAHAAKVALIAGNRRKTDRIDAELLARLARVDPQLLYPVRHRGEQAQCDLAVVRSRDVAVRSRTQLINHVRGTVKALGYRLSSCDSRVFAERMRGEIPRALAPALLPLLEQIGQLSERIQDYDRQIEGMHRRYPETERLRQVSGVGPISSLAYVLILEDPRRFATSRSVGAYLGLVPKLDESGESSPQLRITKEGDPLLRRLLLQCAHYILAQGEDSDLRRFGEAIRRRGGSIAKKKAAIAVARKLAVLLHRLWRTGEAYDPLYQARRRQARADDVAQAA